MAYLTQFRSALLGSAAVLGVVVLSPTVLAQETGTASILDPNEGFNSPEDSGDIFSDPMGPMDLIHRAVLMNNMSLSEFREQQEQRITNEAASFRERQQAAIRQAEVTEVEATETLEPVE